MLGIARTAVAYRELLAIMAWKQIIVRYKQSYLGIVWAVLKPVTLMLVFTLLNSFVAINTGTIPYPVLAFTALLPWVFVFLLLPISFAVSKRAKRYFAGVV